ncbi:MAG: hypothetical protein FWG40_08000 [Peptococcaceae bacterium]|nr:hypothetical protein [Peptococcaceae bacterium]
MNWGLLVAIWLALLVYLIWACFRLLSRGEKKELLVFGCWLFLLGIFISINVHSKASDLRFAELFLQLFR